MGIREDTGAFRVSGTNLRYRAWQPDDPEAAVAIVHGLSDHGGRYEETGRALAGRGIAAWAVDLRGHGRSGGRRGHAHRFDQLLDDLDRFLEVVRRPAPARPLFLLGHSMGGLLVIRHVQERRSGIRGAIVVSPWLGTEVPVPSWKTALAGLFSRILPWLPFRAGIPAELLCHDPGVVRAYRDDPLVHDTITPRLFREASLAMERAAAAPGLVATPVLFLLAGGDRIVSTPRSEAFARAVRPDLATVRVVPGAWHEVLNEADRADRLGEIAGFVRALARAGP